jgi:hypothetical protein
MKKTYTLLTALLCFSGIQLSEAQSVIIPSANPSATGASNSVWRKPFGTNRSYERTAIKYTHAEINTMGQITDIGFYVDSIDVPGFAVTKIYMKEVTDSTFTASTVATEETGAMLVYNDTIPASSFIKGQWTMVTLSSPFTHTTTNNIEIIIETNSVTGTDVASLAKGFRYSTVTGAREQYWQSGSATSTTVPAVNGTLINGNRHNVQLVFAALPPCTTPPTAGMTVASNDTTCAGQIINFSLSGSASGTGLTYQWYTSADSLNWSAIPGATSSTYGTAVSSTSYFMCVVTCSAQSDSASGALVYVKPFYECYCYTGLGGSCTAAIDSVSITSTTLANGPTGCAPTFYTLYPASGSTTATLSQGQTYQVVSEYLGNAKASVWIDYNHNSVFEASEWTQLCTTSATGVAVNSTLNIPLTAMTGVTGMRIRSRGNTATNDSTSACTNFGSGEVEDYLVTIAASPACVAPPDAGIAAATPDTICAGTSTTVAITGYTFGTGTTFEWISSTDSGLNWSTVSGATNANFSTTPSASTWYACIVSCSGQSDTSTIAMVTIQPFYNCYCTAGIGGGCATQTGTTIDSVAIQGTTLANGLTGCAPSFYTMYPAAGNTTASLANTVTYNLDVLLAGNAKCEMWIDYDQSGTFDATEATLVCLTATAGVVNSVAFTVPLSAAQGLTGMRLRSRSTAGGLDSTMGCTAFGSGETEDYLVTIDITLGEKSLEQANQLYIFPNPTNGLLNVAAHVSNQTRMTWQVINVNGEVVYNEQNTAAAGTVQKAINLSALPKGVYFVKVISDKKVMTKKVVLQ